LGYGTGRGNGKLPPWIMTMKELKLLDEGDTVFKFRLPDPDALGVGTFYGVRPIHGS
jgi:hypothetical protein